MRLCLCLLCLLLPLVAARADTIRLVYFPMPSLVDEVDGKAVGAAVDLLKTLTEGLPTVDQPMNMPPKRLERTLLTEKAIAIGLGRSARRERLGLTWVIELFRDDYYFVTMTGHRPIMGLEDARKSARIVCKLGGAPADFLIERGFTNLDYATTLQSEAGKLHAGRVDGWFGLRTYIDHTWRSLGYDPDELHWSNPVPGAVPIWIAASPLVDPAVIETLRQRYAALREQGKLDPVFTDHGR